jgi:hypothetical protein
VIEQHEDLQVAQAISQQLLRAGFPAMMADRYQARAVKQLVDKTLDADWRDSFMAALASGATAGTAKTIADDAAKIIQARRASSNEDSHE